MHTYQEELVRQKLSDEISQSEIADYYEKNKSLFVLDKSIVKGLFIKVPLQSTGLADVRRWYKKNEQEAIEKLGPSNYVEPDIPATESVNKSELELLIVEAKSWKKTEYDVANWEWSNFLAEIEMANAVFESDGSTQSEVDYAKKNTQVDYVHLWLADAADNWCECEACQEYEPSDHYVRLLNEIDEALTGEGLDTRIVMIMYVETVRPPKALKLNNPNRFLMTVAIGNHYENGYKKVETDEEKLPPNRATNAFSAIKVNLSSQKIKFSPPNCS
jgi:hypothetical protein